MHSKVLEELIKNGVPYKEIKHADFTCEIKSPNDFARVLQIDLVRITKSVFLRIKNKDHFLMAVCSCKDKLDLPKLANLAGYGKLEIASKDKLNEVIGYPANGVCAIGVPVDVFMEESLLVYDRILTGAGVAGIEIEIDPKDLARISHAQLANIII
ncbi:YbaK/EbsC family protein [Pedobacter agri]|uniref:aminoacyl-tRNA deacylase n=1 Tax=Pedobacter agri TaxID=454586 RepID=UPI00292F3311|nr:YbaK/EbsC family protein [Pedobacter agri]